MNGKVFVRREYGIDFLDKDGELVEEMVFETPEERLVVYNGVSSDDDHPSWPETAVEYWPWERDVYRAPIRGVDYGPGSVQRRFPGMRVPRSAYRFTGDK